MEESKRQAQIASEIQRGIGEAFLELEFPKGSFVTITRVIVLRDLSSATVYLTVMPDHAWNGVKNVLKAAARELQHAADARLTSHITPKLHFELDVREQKARHLEALLDEVQKNR